jgi:hypothetical protein
LWATSPIRTDPLLLLGCLACIDSGGLRVDFPPPGLLPVCLQAAGKGFGSFGVDTLSQELSLKLKLANDTRTCKHPTVNGKPPEAICTLEPDASSLHRCLQLRTTGKFACARSAPRVPAVPVLAAALSS